MYKINSFWIELDPSLTIIERHSYSVLDWVGDVGGLLDGLKVLGGFFVAPIATFALKVELLSLSVSKNCDEPSFL